MKNAVIPRSEYPFQPKTREQLIRTFTIIHAILFVYLVLTTVHYQYFDMGNLMSAILSFIWELGIFPIVILVVFSLGLAVFILFKKQKGNIIPFMVLTILNALLIFGWSWIEQIL